MISDGGGGGRAMPPNFLKKNIYIKILKKNYF
jgi:hypothetical protein